MPVCYLTPNILLLKNGPAAESYAYVDIQGNFVSMINKKQTKTNFMSNRVWASHNGSHMRSYHMLETPGGMLLLTSDSGVICQIHPISLKIKLLYKTSAWNNNRARVASMLKNGELVTCTIDNQLTKIVDGKIVDRVVIINPEQYADISDMVCSHGFIWILAHIGSKGVQLFRFTEDLKQRKKFQVHTEDITTDMHPLKILYISEAKTYLQFVDRYNNILITAIVS